MYSVGFYCKAVLTSILGKVQVILLSYQQLLVLSDTCLPFIPFYAVVEIICSCSINVVRSIFNQNDNKLCWIKNTEWIGSVDKDRGRKSIFTDFSPLHPILEANDWIE